MIFDVHVPLIMEHIVHTGNFGFPGKKGTGAPFWFDPYSKFLTMFNHQSSALASDCPKKMSFKADFPWHSVVYYIS